MLNMLFCFSPLVLFSCFLVASPHDEYPSIRILGEISSHTKTQLDQKRTFILRASFVLFPRQSAKLQSTNRCKNVVKTRTKQHCWLGFEQKHSILEPTKSMYSLPKHGSCIWSRFRGIGDEICKTLEKCVFSKLRAKKKKEFDYSCNFWSSR